MTTNPVKVFFYGSFMDLEALADTLRKTAPSRSNQFSEISRRFGTQRKLGDVSFPFTLNISEGLRKKTGFSVRMKFSRIVSCMFLVAVALGSVLVPAIHFASNPKSKARASVQSSIGSYTPVNLSYGTGVSHSPVIATSGSHAYVIYVSAAPILDDLFITSSDDNGTSFSPSLDLTINRGFILGLPQIAASGSHVYIVWSAIAETFLATSADYGHTFSPATSIANVSNPRIVATGDDLYAVWLNSSLAGTNTIFRASTDDGKSFGPFITISSGQGESDPQIAASGSNVYVAWQSCTGSIGACGSPMFRRSPDYGKTFDPAISIDPADPNARYPVLAAVGNDVYVAWYDAPSAFSWQVVVRASTDGGATLQPPVRISNDTVISTFQGRTSIHPKIAASGSNVYLVWNDDNGTAPSFDRTFEAYFSRSPNYGVNFTAPVNLSNTLTDSDAQGLVVSGDNVYAIWDTYVGGNYTISLGSSPDAGANFATPLLLGPDTEGFMLNGGPSLSVSGSHPFVAWTENTGQGALGGAKIDVFFWGGPAHGTKGLSKGTIAGKVVYNSQPIGFARVTATVRLSTGFYFTAANATDYNGDYSLTVFAGNATVTAYGNSFWSAAQNIMIQPNTVTALNLYLESGYLTIQLFTKYLGGSWQGPLPFDYRVAWGFQLKVTDAFNNEYSIYTQPMPVGGFPGDKLRICVNGDRFGLPSACQVAILDNNRNATASIYLAQLGEVRGNVVEAATGRPISGWLASVYSLDASGSRTFVSSHSNATSSLVIGLPRAGEYQIEVENWTGAGWFFGSVAFSVAEGSTVQLGNIMLYPEGFFGGREGNQVLASPTETTPDETVAIRGSFKNDGPGQATNTTLIIEVPSGTSLLQGSITLNGAQVTGARSVATGYAIALGDLPEGSSGIVGYRLRLSPDFNASSLDPSVMIEYGSVQSRSRELIGRVSVRIYGVQLFAPSETSRSILTISGNAPPQSTVRVYDGTLLLGETMARGGGAWTLAVVLPDLGSPSEHSLRATATTPSAKSLSSPVLHLIFNQNHPEPIQACMQQNTGVRICFDPSKGVAEFPYVYVPDEPITFELRYPDASAVAHVQVVLQGAGAQNATLGSDGVFRATFSPPFKSLGAVSFTSTPQYVPRGGGTLPQPPSPSEIRAGMLDPFRNGVYKVLSSDSNGFVLEGRFSNGLVYRTSIRVVRDVAYEPTMDDLAQIQDTGFPIFNFQSSFSSPSQSERDIQFSYFLRYSDLPPDVVTAIDSIASMGVEIVGDIYEYEAAGKSLGLGYEAVSWAGEASFERDLEAEAAQYSKCISNISSIQSADPGSSARFDNQVKEMQSDISFYTTGSNAWSFVSNAAEALPGPWGKAATVITYPLTREFELGKESVKEEVSGLVGEQCTPPDAKPRWLLDPSGFVYEAVTTNRLANVTATIFYQDPATGLWATWDASDYGQQNGQLTDVNGRYGWDVTPGKWMVTFEKPGYQTLQSRVVGVPPPVTDLNVGLVSFAPPRVIGVSAISNATASYITVVFDKYVMASNITGQNMFVTTDVISGNISGTVMPLNPNLSPQGVLLTREARLVPTQSLSLSSSYTVHLSHGVESYANVSMTADYTAIVNPVSALTYTLSLDPTNRTVTIGRPVTATGTSNDAVSTNVAFGWKDPNGFERSSESVATLSASAHSTSFVPDETGDWTVTASFTDGNNVLQTRTSTFKVVKPIPSPLGGSSPIQSSTVSLTFTSLNSTGGAYIDARPLNGIQVWIEGATSAPGTRVDANSFLYASSPDNTPNLASQTGASLLLMADVHLTNVGGTATVCITNTLIGSSNWMLYLDTTTARWTQGRSIRFQSPNSLCGKVPVASLHGTPIAVTRAQPPTYTISFNEDGLPAGTMWQVTLDGWTLSSTKTINFTEPNGEYNYTVGAMNGYTAEPSAGTITVDSHPVTRVIVWKTSSPVAPAPTPSLLFGLQPLLFYGIIGGIIAAVAVMGVAFYLRKPNTSLSKSKQSLMIVSF